MNKVKNTLRYFRLMLILIGTLILAAQAWAVPPAGNVWTGSGPFATGLGNRTINAIAIDPTNPNIIYAGTGSGTVFQYTTVLPSVTTEAATGVVSDAATLNATVNANNADTDVTFEYGLDDSYGATIAGVPPTVTGTSNTSVSAPLSGLTAGMTYHYRVVGDSSAGVSYGLDATFITPRIDQTITFGALGSKTFGDAPFTVSATGGLSGNPVTFSIFSGPATATGLNGSTITLTGAGSVTVRASQAGNDNYNPATDVDQTFTVSKANTVTTITSDSPDPSPQGQSVTVDFSVTSSAGTPTGSVTVGDGTVSCTASIAAGSGSCSLTFGSLGSSTLTATYAGDDNFNGSASAGEPHGVCLTSVTVANGNDSGPGTLRQAIADICPGGTIDFGVTGDYHAHIRTNW